MGVMTLAILRPLQYSDLQLKASLLKIEGRSLRQPALQSYRQGCKRFESNSARSHKLHVDAPRPPLLYGLRSAQTRPKTCVALKAHSSCGRSCGTPQGAVGIGGRLKVNKTATAPSKRWRRHVHTPFQWHLEVWTVRRNHTRTGKAKGSNEHRGYTIHPTSSTKIRCPALRHGVSTRGYEHLYKERTTIYTQLSGDAAPLVDAATSCAREAHAEGDSKQSTGVVSFFIRLLQRSFQKSGAILWTPQK